MKCRRVAEVIYCPVATTIVRSSRIKTFIVSTINVINRETERSMLSARYPCSAGAYASRTLIRRGGGMSAALLAVLNQASTRIF
jgi:hypothetical protein